MQALTDRGDAWGDHIQRIVHNDREGHRLRNERLDEETRENERRAEELQRAFEDRWINPMQSALTSGLDKMLTDWQGFGEAMKGILKEIRNEAIRAAVIRPLGNFIGGGIGSAVASLFGQSAPGRQLGGPVSVGTPSVVGEAGPELFIPSANGQIVPSGVASVSSGSGDNYYFYSNDTTAAVGALMEFRDQLERGVRTQSGFDRTRAVGGAL